MSDDRVLPLGDDDLHALAAALASPEAEASALPGLGLVSVIPQETMRRLLLRLDVAERSLLGKHRKLAYLQSCGVSGCPWPPQFHAHVVRTDAEVADDDPDPDPEAA